MAGHPLRTPRPFSRVLVFTSLDDVRPIWERLLEVAPCSPYQRWDWVRAWLQTEGRHAGVTPWIPVAITAEGDPAALLPLGLRRRGPLRLASFLGGQQTNYNIGLYDPTLTWSADDGEALLRAGSAVSPESVDLFKLLNQPETWDGFVNPLAWIEGSRPSPSLGHRAVLTRDADAFFKAHQSGPARKKLRAKAGNLATIGPVHYARATDEATIAAVVEAHISQKAAKLALLGISHAEPDRLRRYLLGAARSNAEGTGPLELHALWSGDRIVATFGGVAHSGRFSGSVISHELDPAVARCSPGEVLLTAVIRAKCEDGFTGFDLGIGEARYKNALCPVDDGLRDGFLALTTKGQAFAAAAAGKQRLKVRVKRSPRLWSMVQAVRRARARLTPR